MIQVDMTLHDVKPISTSTNTRDISVNNYGSTAEVEFETDKKTVLSLLDVSFKKKMYQPTEVIAKIQIGVADTSFVKKDLESVFKNVKVSLNMWSLTEGKINFPYQVSVGNDFYVHEVLVSYQKATYVTLKIYSLDKKLTMTKESRTFVSKKLGADILKSEIVNYKKPYKLGENESETLEYATNLKILVDNKVVSTSNTIIGKTIPIIGSYLSSIEHIHPYLVQYNESFYDMLARTANRWGEFLYYESGKLNLGYPNSEKSIGNYRNIYYLNLGSEDSEMSVKYDYVGADEKSFIDTLLKESPNEISGTTFYPNGKEVKVAMNYMASIFKNEKNIPTFLVNKTFDDSFDIAYKAISVGHKNSKFNEKYFPEEIKPGVSDQYGKHNFGTEENPDNKNAFNQFTEIHTNFNSSKYVNIYTKELSAGKNAICIEYDSICPDLKLGDIINFNNEKYIVIELSTKNETTFEIVKDEETQKDIVQPNNSLVLQVIATSSNKVEDSVQKTDETGNKVFEKAYKKDEDGEFVLDANKNQIQIDVPVMENRLVDNNYYPIILPSGHVRYSDPQIATVTDAADPTGNNRVRVKFPWEKIETKKKKIQDEAKKTSSPWLTFATNASGSPAVGLHYEGDKVLIGFVGGNIERPYVLGGLASKGSDADVIQTTPGGHAMKLNDDSTGIIKFVSGMFWPGWKTLGSFIPQMSEIDCSANKSNLSLGGGFELSDDYGVYKISGSTDKRNITVSSPWGDVKMDAFTGITISAPNGDISIKGKNVKIEAGNNLELTSGTNVKYKLVGEGGPSGFFSDIGAAVIKKIGEMVASVITVDLSLVRSFVEIAIRPAEGKLLVKSNRYLMLESGKGACDYPVDDYHDYNKSQNVLKVYMDNQYNLDLLPGVTESMAMVADIANKIDRGYREKYNTCCDKYKKFMDMIDTTTRFANDYHPQNKPAPKIMKDYSELDNVLWADPPQKEFKSENKLKPEDLGFKDNFKAETKDDVSNELAGQFEYLNKTLDDVKRGIIRLRRRRRDDLLDFANDLRNAIWEFLNFKKSKLDELLENRNYTSKLVPESFKDALATAFKKDLYNNLTYFAPVTDQKKALLQTEKYNDVDDLKNDRKVLKRRAAAIMLKEMGFKDEWREKVNDPGWAPDPLNPLAVAPKVPVSLQIGVDAEIQDDVKWNNYVDSIRYVPNSSEKRNTAETEGVKLIDNFINNYTQVTKLAENKCWGKPENGSILFSYNGDVYNMKDRQKVEVIHRALDTDNTKVNDFLNHNTNGLKAKMKDLK